MEHYGNYEFLTLTGLLTVETAKYVNGATSAPSHPGRRRIRSWHLIASLYIGSKGRVVPIVSRSAECSEEAKCSPGSRRHAPGSREAAGHLKGKTPPTAAAAAPAVCLSNEHDPTQTLCGQLGSTTGSVRRTLIRDIGEECAGEGSAGAFKDLTNKTCQRELGGSQN
ncbi:unnamed protein product [Pleuronectes platessa]|uniref:Uncharacterized protein n=1 Tax=Pleuronectes platessa TaxID=8262 RepID=A0A9N7Y2Q5_PLEPL|nr:unnamed protein product [Pleuronectes platessa]